MNLKSTFLSLSLLFAANLFAQNREEFIYASMEAKHAQELKLSHSDLIEIIAINNDLASVYIHPEVTHELHQKILSHGPGYMFHATESNALNTINSPLEMSRTVLEYSITNQEYVKTLLDDVNKQNIEEVMQHLESYGSRYHLSAQANEAAEDLKVRWENLIAAANRTEDISVRIVSHVNTPMKSVVLTIKGNENASQYVIVGGHLDSIVGGSNKTYAPGSDDNASGIATITEIIRVLLANDYKPQKTVEFMAYAAEEIGLVGSNEIATQYKNQGKDVFGYVQFDMTAYKGSSKDVYVSIDSFNNNDLNLFLYELMEEYNSFGDHKFTYATTRCNYGCSDHYSWAMKGYPAAFPFEASFNDSNPYIHTTSDTFDKNGDGSHAAKFAKLGLEFVVEAAKRSEVLDVVNLNKTKAKFYVDQKAVGFEVPSNKTIKSATVINVAGQKVATKNQVNINDKINLNQLPNGAYILLLETTSGEKLTYKFILK